jgi:hypothetical protein
MNQLRVTLSDQSEKDSDQGKREAVHTGKEKVLPHLHSVCSGFAVWFDRQILNLFVLNPTGRKVKVNLLF